MCYSTVPIHPLQFFRRVTEVSFQDEHSSPLRETRKTFRHPNHFSRNILFCFLYISSQNMHPVSCSRIPLILGIFFVAFPLPFSFYHRTCFCVNTAETFYPCRVLCYSFYLPKYLNILSRLMRMPLRFSSMPSNSTLIHPSYPCILRVVSALGTFTSP